MLPMNFGTPNQHCFGLIRRVENYVVTTQQIKDSEYAHDIEIQVVPYYRIGIYFGTNHEDRALSVCQNYIRSTKKGSKANLQYYKTHLSSILGLK